MGHFLLFWGLDADPYFISILCLSCLEHLLLLFFSSRSTMVVTVQRRLTSKLLQVWRWIRSGDSGGGKWYGGSWRSEAVVSYSGNNLGRWAIGPVFQEFVWNGYIAAIRPRIRIYLSDQFKIRNLWTTFHQRSAFRGNEQWTLLPWKAAGVEFLHHRLLKSSYVTETACIRPFNR